MKLVSSYIYIGILYIVFIIISLLVNSTGYAQQIRAELEPGIYAVCYPSYKIFIECYSNLTKNINQWLISNLQNPADAQTYQKAKSFVIPLYKFKYTIYTSAFTKLFPNDSLTQEGWIHTVPAGYTLNKESLNIISIALTGNSNNLDKIIASPLNKGKALPLNGNEKILVPSQLLLKEIKVRISQAQNKSPILNPIDPGDESLPEVHMKTVSSNIDIVSSPQPQQIKVNHPELKYGKDAKGEYFSYKVKKGETIYKNVVPRFTIYKTEKERIAISKEILKRSGLTSERQVKTNCIIKIPINYIKPELINGIPNELPTKFANKEILKNTVVVIDPGHGGKDQGASREFEGVYEDELNYDVAVRVMKYLKEHTHSKVFITLQDNSQGFEPYNGKTFKDDEDEVILVTPPYSPLEKISSAHLRWILANSIMRKNEAIGIPKDNILFISIHFDSLPNTYRGARIFVPSSSHRQEIQSPKSSKINFSSFAEWRDNRPRVLTASEKIKDEEYSRKFASILLSNLKQSGIATYNKGEAIQEIINRSPRSTFVPAVLRNTEIPTKVLIECANLNNSEDLSNVTDPAWRQKLAEVIAQSIISYLKK